MFRNIKLVLVLAATLLSGCSLFGDGEENDRTKNWSASKLYSEAKASLSGGDFETAIKYYESLQARFPFGQFAQQALIDVAFAYYKTGEPESAIASADRFIKLYPTHPNVDYAFYLKGLSNFNRGSGFIERYLPQDVSQRDSGASQASFASFSELVNRFPQSRYAEDSRQRMLFLRNNLAYYELRVADYYMRRGAYIAAARRAAGVVANYDRTPAIPYALRIMTDAYEKLDMADLSNDSNRVLRMNYPEHPAMVAGAYVPEFEAEGFIGAFFDTLNLEE